MKQNEKTKRARDFRYPKALPSLIRRNDKHCSHKPQNRWNKRRERVWKGGGREQRRKYQKKDKQESGRVKWVCVSSSPTSLPRYRGRILFKCVADTSSLRPVIAHHKTNTTGLKLPPPSQSQPSHPPLHPSVFLLVPSLVSVLPLPPWFFPGATSTSHSLRQV